MRFLGTIIGLAAATTAFAQNNPPSPYPMPGTVVGRPSLTPVGTAFPKVAPTNGTPLGYTGPDGNPINVGQRPAGQLIDMTNLAAPLAAPLPPDLAGMQPKTYLEQLYDKWRAMLGFAPTPAQPVSTWVPGISRRNKERREAKQQQWQRD